jgi:hypothetical protein
MVITMKRHFVFAMICALSAVVLVLSSTCRALLTDTTRRDPRTLAEAAQVAEQLSLFCRVDGVEGGRLIVSETPLTQKRCAEARLDPRYSGWRGTIAVYPNWQTMMPMYDPMCSAVWGELFLYGDPRLIAKVTGMVR